MADSCNSLMLKIHFVYGELGEEIYLEIPLGYENDLVVHTYFFFFFLFYSLSFTIVTSTSTACLSPQLTSLSFLSFYSFGSVPDWTKREQLYIKVN